LGLAIQPCLPEGFPQAFLGRTLDPKVVDFSGLAQSAEGGGDESDSTKAAAGNRAGQENQMAEQYLVVLIIGTGVLWFLRYEFTPCSERVAAYGRHPANDEALFRRESPCLIEGQVLCGNATRCAIQGDAIPTCFRRPLKICRPVYDYHQCRLVA
jgi:hypothetical protein